MEEKHVFEQVNSYRVRDHARSQPVAFLPFTYSEKINRKTPGRRMTKVNQRTLPVLQSSLITSSPARHKNSFHFMTDPTQISWSLTRWQALRMPIFSLKVLLAYVDPIVSIILLFKFWFTTPKNLINSNKNTFQVISILFDLWFVVLQLPFLHFNLIWQLKGNFTKFPHWSMVTGLGEYYGTCKKKVAWRRLWLQRKLSVT